MRFEEDILLWLVLDILALYAGWTVCGWFTH
nr:MAG TPA: Superinfection immunity protein [Caudoviricetes sp.]